MELGVEVSSTKIITINRTLYRKFIENALILIQITQFGF